MLQERLQESLGSSRRDSRRFQQPPGDSWRLREAPAEQTTDFLGLALKNIWFLSTRTPKSRFVCKTFLKKWWFCSEFSPNEATLLSVYECHFSKCRRFCIRRTPRNRGNLTHTKQVYYQMEGRTLNARRMVRAKYGGSFQKCGQPVTTLLLIHGILGRLWVGNTPTGSCNYDHTRGSHLCTVKFPVFPKQRMLKGSSISLLKGQVSAPSAPTFLVWDL